MYTLTPHGYLLRGPQHTSTCRNLAPPHARAPATASPTIKLPPSAAHTAAGAARDPSLRSTWSHRAWAAAGFASVFAPLASSAAAAVDSGAVAEPLLAALLGYVLADLGTGVYHWAIDNYGGPSTPVFGSQIEAFQGHHRRPWTITRRQFANNLHALARAVALTVGPVEFVAHAGGGGGDAAVQAFIGTCAGCVLLSQQFHAWAHAGRGRLPPAVAALQDAGVLVSRRRHVAHHRPPYNNNYCIVSGVWNDLLDGCKVFEALEMVVFFRFGVRPRSWSQPGSNWTEEIPAESTRPKL